MCVGEILCHFMCTLYVHYLKRPRAFTSRLPSTFYVPHIFRRISNAHNKHTMLCSTKYIYSGTHIFVVYQFCVCTVGRALLISVSFPLTFSCWVAFIWRRCRAMLYYTMHVIWNGWQKWTFSESKKAITTTTTTTKRGSTRSIKM